MFKHMKKSESDNTLYEQMLKDAKRMKNVKRVYIPVALFEKSYDSAKLKQDSSDDLRARFFIG